MHSLYQTALLAYECFHRKVCLASNRVTGDFELFPLKKTFSLRTDLYCGADIEVAVALALALLHHTQVDGSDRPLGGLKEHEIASHLVSCMLRP